MLCWRRNVVAGVSGACSLRAMSKNEFPRLLRRSGKWRQIVLGVFRGIHLLPFAMDDAFADLRGRFALASLLVRIKIFLLADIASGAVAADKAIEQAAMSLAAVAVAIARLLVKNFLRAAGNPVRVEGLNVGEDRCVHRLRQGILRRLRVKRRRRFVHSRRGELWNHQKS